MKHHMLIIYKNSTVNFYFLKGWKSQYTINTLNDALDLIKYSNGDRIWKLLKWGEKELCNIEWE